MGVLSPNHQNLGLHYMLPPPNGFHWGLVPPAHLVDDAGSVVCLWIRVRRRMWSFMDICTSAGMSGDVWLIFTAASRKLMVPVSWSLSAMFSLLQSASLCKTARLEEMALFLQGTQHSFQKRNRKTATRASPHTITITARRLTESSTGGEKATVTGSGRSGKGEKKREMVRKPSAKGRSDPTWLISCLLESSQQVLHRRAKPKWIPRSLPSASTSVEKRTPPDR